MFRPAPLLFTLPRRPKYRGRVSVCVLRSRELDHYQRVVLRRCRYEATDRVSTTGTVPIGFSRPDRLAFRGCARLFVDADTPTRPISSSSREKNDAFFFLPTIDFYVLLERRFVRNRFIDRHRNDFKITDRGSKHERKRLCACAYLQAHCLIG